MVKTFFCPGCGAAMTFDPDTQRLTCAHCGNSMSMEEAELQSQKNQSGDAADTAGSSNGETEKDEKLDFKVYKCPTCGAEILTDKYTSATMCSFCGNPGLMEDRIEGILKPSYIIPFTLDKDKAADIFRKWTKSGHLTPSDFNSTNTIEKMTGMYVPYWMYDFKVKVNMHAHATKETRKVSGDYEHIYTHHYDVVRDAVGDYNKIPADASEKLDDDMMDTLEPFKYENLIGFQDSYLLGYQAERYNFTSDELEDRAKKRAFEYAEKEVRKSISGYNSVNVVSKNTEVRSVKAAYAMLPVWILNYRYNKKNYTIAINGQTGKLVGTLPISKGKAWISFLVSTGIVFTVLSIVSIILH